MSIVVVGSVAFDSIATPSGKVQDILGGSGTYFALSASYFTDVRVVAVVGEDFTAKHEEVFKKRNIDIRGIEHAKGKTFRWGGQYLDNLNEAKTDFTELNVFQEFQPQIPAQYMDSKFLFLGNIQPTLQAEVRRLDATMHAPAPIRISPADNPVERQLELLKAAFESDA